MSLRRSSLLQNLFNSIVLTWFILKSGTAKTSFTVTGVLLEESGVVFNDTGEQSISFSLFLCVATNWHLTKPKVFISINT